MPRTVELNTTHALWAIGAVAALIATTAGATWYIRNDRIDELNHEIEMLKSSREWKLPETLQALKDVSEKVRLNMEERETLDKLKVDNDSLTKKNNELQSEISKVTDRLSEVESVLKKSISVSAKPELAEGESADLIANDVSVGVLSIYYPDGAHITFRDSDETLYVGKRSEFDYAGHKCALKLDRLFKVKGLEKAAFSFGCSQQ
jgi:hypothetical protein